MTGWTTEQRNCHHPRLSSERHSEFVAVTKVRYRATWADCLVCGVSVQTVRRAVKEKMG